MELTGLGLTQVLTALGITGGAVVVLYILKLRRRQVTVPFVKLWEQVLAEKQSTRLFSQLKRILSLLLALLIVALIAFALGDPRWEGASATGRTVVLLVDASASMQTVEDGGTRLQLAQSECRRIIEGLGPADRALIARMEATTTPLTSLSAQTGQLLDALGTLEATDVAADLNAGLRFGLDILREEPEPEIVVLSDGRLEPAHSSIERLASSGVRLSFVPIGTRSDNVAITAFSVRRYPLDKSQSEVLVELWNPSTHSMEVELTLLGDTEPVDVQRLQIAAGERLRRFFGNISGADRTLEARVTLADGTADALPADNHAFARLPERRRARVLAVTEGNLYLSAALLLDEYLDVTEIDPAQYPSPEHFDVIIFDSWVPPTTPDTSAIYLYPTTDDPTRGPFEITGEIERPFFERINRDHPLSKWTALGDVNVASAVRVRLQEGDRPIAADARGALIVAGTRSGTRMVAFTFDVRRSDLPLRVAWPLLLLNTIDWFVEDNAGYVSSYRTGETWHIPAPAGAESTTVVDPRGDARDVPVVEGRAVYAGTRVGFYTLKPQGDPAPDADAHTTFAANFGPGDESDITPQASLDVGEVSAQSPTHGKPGVRSELWIYLVLFALLVLVFEWLSYHRRWTV